MQDRELLELAVLKVPWYMVCGDFHHRYGSAGALARRLFELSDRGTMSLHPKRWRPMQLRTTVTTISILHAARAGRSWLLTVVLPRSKKIWVNNKCGRRFKK